jgi:ferredoxin
MCEFCTEHGEGKQWYLAMKNYGQEYLVVPERRQYVRHFFQDFEASAARSLPWLDAIQALPFIPDLVTRTVIANQKKRHFGQVVPIEDVNRILGMVTSVVRIPCACRSLTTGTSQTRYCYGLGIDPAGTIGELPDYAGNLEWLTPNQAQAAIRGLDEEGLVHSVWTFDTPFIAGLCNCDQDCMAYRLQITTRLLQVFFPAEYAAQIDPDLCTGCKLCQKRCPFSAIQYDRQGRKCAVDPRLCYGCGVCRTTCKKGAIQLAPNNRIVPWSRRSQSRVRFRIQTRQCVDATHCGQCLAACQHQVLGMVPNQSRAPGIFPGEWQVKPVFPTRCDGCGACVAACPEGSISTRPVLFF